MINGRMAVRHHRPQAGDPGRLPSCGGYLLSAACMARVGDAAGQCQRPDCGLDRRWCPRLVKWAPGMWTKRHSRKA